MKDPSPHKPLLDALHHEIMPWAKSDSLHLVFAHPPLRARAPVQIEWLRSPLLKQRHGRRDHQSNDGPVGTHWPKEHLFAPANPHLAFVLEGVADIRLGFTEQMALANPAAGLDSGVCVVRMPRASLLVTPPGMPYSDNALPHWEGPGLDSAVSSILWLNVLPEGVVAHICRTRGSEHSVGQKAIVIDGHLHRIAVLLIEQLQGQDLLVERPNQRQVVLFHLQALLLRIADSFTVGEATSDQSGKPTIGRVASNVPALRHPARPRVATLQRACQYIEEHLGLALTAGDVAAHAYASTSHLNSLFRDELDTSLMAYVTDRRMSTAKFLLENTDLSIASISGHLGFRHVTHFSQLFKRRMGISPKQYRAKQRGTSAEASSSA